MYLEIATAAAMVGGEVLMDKFGTSFRVEHKGEVDLVTEADKAAEKAIVTLIRERSPEHDILAEEEDYGRQQREFCWIIDPLDGTTNYAHGFPWFAVSVALERNGSVIAGVVFNPCNNELFTAAVGKGAWLKINRYRFQRHPASTNRYWRPGSHMTVSRVKPITMIILCIFNRPLRPVVVPGRLASTLPAPPPAALMAIGR